MIDEKFIEKLERGEDVSADDILRDEAEKMLALHRAEIARRKEVARFEEAAARGREQTIQQLIELNREAEEAAEAHAEVFRQREEMLKQSARAEGQARGRWYRIYQRFSALSKRIDSDASRVDAELAERGARVDAARENVAKLPASDAFHGLVLSGEFREDSLPERSEQEKMVEALQLAAVINSAHSNRHGRGDYGDIGDEPPPKKAA